MSGFLRDLQCAGAALACAAAATLASGASPAEANGNPLMPLWPINEGSGQTVRDWSGKGHNGTLGATSGNEASDPTWFNVSTTRYYKRKALRFDGTDYVRVPRSARLEPSRISVGAVVRATGSPGAYRYVVSKGALQCLTASYGLYTGPDGGLRFYISDGSTYALSADAGTTLWDGNWHVALGTFDGTQVSLFVDGKEVGTAVPTTLSLGYGLADDNALYIGDYRGTCASPLGFVGDIDTVVVADRPFTWSGY